MTGVFFWRGFWLGALAMFGINCLIFILSQYLLYREHVKGRKKMLFYEQKIAEKKKEDD